MAKLALKKAATDVTVYLFAQDNSKTTGAGLTGLAYNTASLTAYYVRPLGSAAAITLATQTVTGAHSDGGFVEVDAKNMPGVYRLDLPDAVCATGVPSVVVMLKGAANLAPVLLEIQLTDFDLNTAFTSALVADAVLDEATSGHTSAGSFSKAVTDILADTGTDGVVVASLATDSITAAALKADAVTEITNDIFAEVIENSLSYKQVIQVMAAVLAGKVTGGATGTITFKDLADAVNRVVMTVDASGNRSAVQTNFS